MARKMKTMDGNNAAAWVSYPFTDLAAIYPITPSSPMAEVTDQWSAKDKKNLFGQPVQVVECSPKQALQALFTALFQQVLLQQLILLHRVFSL